MDVSSNDPLMPRGFVSLFNLCVAVTHANDMAIEPGIVYAIINSCYSHKLSQ